jgi:hypothetical protein
MWLQGERAVEVPKRRSGSGQSPFRGPQLPQRDRLEGIRAIQPSQRGCVVADVPLGDAAYPQDACNPSEDAVPGYWAEKCSGRKCPGFKDTPDKSSNGEVED